MKSNSPMQSDSSPQTRAHLLVFALALSQGLLALPAFAQATFEQDAQGLISIEAEHFDAKLPQGGHDWIFGSQVANRSGLGHMQALPESNVNRGAYPDLLTQSPRLDFKVNFVKTGTHYIWIRGVDGGGDSVHAGIDNDNPATARRIDGAPGYGPAASADWRWVGNIQGDLPATIEVAIAGVHTVNIWMREDGFIVDKIVLTTDFFYAPSDAGPPETLSATASFPPVAGAFNPPNNAVGVAPNPILRAQIIDQNSAVQTNTIRLFLNQSAVQPSIVKSNELTTLEFRITELLPPLSTNRVALVFTDSGSRTTTNLWQFTVGDYATLPSTIAFAAGLQDTAQPGFRVRVHQANTRSGALVNSAERARAQLAGELIDPQTGLPYANDASLGAAGADGFFTDADVLNYNQDTDPAFGTVGSAGNFVPDEAIPGIPGTDPSNANDNIALETLTYLALDAGAHRFGVNSDDGFVVYAGAEPRDFLALPVGRFDGGRGSADTLFSFVAPAAGVYPFRLVWYEGTGGANVEWFSVDPSTEQRILINDTAAANSIRAFRTVTAPTRPYVQKVSPQPGATVVPVDASLQIVLADGTWKVAPASVRLKLNNQVVPHTAATGPGTLTITHDPAAPLAGLTTYTVELVFSDDATPANFRTNTFSFVTERPAITLPPLRQGTDGLVVIEVENYNANIPQGIHRWEFHSATAGTYGSDLAAGYSGDGVMYALPNEPVAVIGFPAALTTSPRLDFQVQFNQTGTHYVWVRASDGGGDSIHVGLNGEDPAIANPTTDNIDEPDCCGTRKEYGGLTYPWINGQTTSVDGRARFEITTNGIYTINVWMREDGLIVDKLVITPDLSYTPVAAGPPESRRVGDRIRPNITLTAPTDGQQFPAAQPITLSADASDPDGTIAKVEFFASGEKVGEDTTAPYSLSWTPTQERVFLITARATDNDSDTRDSAAVRIIAGNPPQVLYVGNNPATQAGDLAFIAHLESRNFLVTALDDNAALTSDADGKSLVVISSTSSSTAIANKFTAVAIPVINWEWAAHDDLLMTATAGAEIANQTSVIIVKADHPLAAGLPTGTVVISTTPQQMASGQPDAAAIVIATAGNGSGIPVYFAFEKDAPLVGGTLAPARRVGLFMGGGTATTLTDDGRKLVNAAINWAMNIVVEPAPELRIQKQGADWVLSWTGGGQLEETSRLGASWTTAANQQNPQTLSLSGTLRFFRVAR